MTEAVKKIQAQIDSRYELIDEYHLDFVICSQEKEPLIENRIKELTAELTVLEAQKKKLQESDLT